MNIINKILYLLYLINSHKYWFRRFVNKIFDSISYILSKHYVKSRFLPTMHFEITYRSTSSNLNVYVQGLYISLMPSSMLSMLNISLTSNSFSIKWNDFMFSEIMRYFNAGKIYQMISMFEKSMNILSIEELTNIHKVLVIPQRHVVVGDDIVDTVKNFIKLFANTFTKLINDNNIILQSFNIFDKVYIFRKFSGTGRIEYLIKFDDNVSLFDSRISQTFEPYFRIECTNVSNNTYTLRIEFPSPLKSRYFMYLEGFDKVFDELSRLNVFRKLELIIKTFELLGSIHVI